MASLASCLPYPKHVPIYVMKVRFATSNGTLVGTSVPFMIDSTAKDIVIEVSRHCRLRLDLPVHEDMVWLAYRDDDAAGPVVRCIAEDAKVATIPHVLSALHCKQDVNMLLVPRHISETLDTPPSPQQEGSAQAVADAFEEAFDRDPDEVDVPALLQGGVADGGGGEATGSQRRDRQESTDPSSPYLVPLNEQKKKSPVQQKKELAVQTSPPRSASVAAAAAADRNPIRAMASIEEIPTTTTALVGQRDEGQKRHQDQRRGSSTVTRSRLSDRIVYDVGESIRDRRRAAPYNRTDQDGVDVPLDDSHIVVGNTYDPSFLPEEPPRRRVDDADAGGIVRRRTRDEVLARLQSSLHSVPQPPIDSETQTDRPTTPPPVQEPSPARAVTLGEYLSRSRERPQQSTNPKPQKEDDRDGENYAKVHPAATAIATPGRWTNTRASAELVNGSVFSKRPQTPLKVIVPPTQPAIEEEDDDGGLVHRSVSENGVDTERVNGNSPFPVAHPQSTPPSIPQHKSNKQYQFVDDESGALFEIDASDVPSRSPSPLALRDTLLRAAEVMMVRSPQLSVQRSRDDDDIVLMHPLLPVGSCTTSSRRFLDAV